MAGAQTGTGKTAGFTLPLLQNLMASPKPKSRLPRALVLVPTRELAAQVAESVRTYGAHLPLRCTQIFGGVGMQKQINQLRRGVEIVVATPGRLLDHAERGTIDLSKIEILVLDEADRMLDMGFVHDIKRVLAMVPARRQNLLFSATIAKDVKVLADKLLNQPRLVEVARRNSTAEGVVQMGYRVDAKRKAELLEHLIKDGDWSQVLVFTRTKHLANKLAEALNRGGITASAIHGNKSQGARTRALAGFKDSTVRVLVATEIAARGLDIDGLPYVVNFELPHVASDYIHRIGRTGRAGAIGRAVSLVCVDEDKLLRDVEKLLGKSLDLKVLPGFEPDPRIRAEPIKNGGRTGGRSGGRRPNHRHGGGGQNRRSNGSRSNARGSGSRSTGHRSRARV